MGFFFIIVGVVVEGLEFRILDLGVVVVGGVLDCICVVLFFVFVGVFIFVYLDKLLFMGVLF